jgi:hypothetical protein
VPHLTDGDPIVRRAWRYHGTPTRIHFVANGGSADRHLHVDEGDPFYAVLDESLRARGYVGPGRPATPVAEALSA